MGEEKYISERLHSYITEIAAFSGINSINYEDETGMLLINKQNFKTIMENYLTIMKLWSKNNQESSNSKKSYFKIDSLLDSMFYEPIKWKVKDNCVLECDNNINNNFWNLIDNNGVINNHEKAEYNEIIIEKFWDNYSIPFECVKIKIGLIKNLFISPYSL